MERRITLDIPKNITDILKYFGDIKEKYNPTSIILPGNFTNDLLNNSLYEKVVEVSGCPVNSYYGKYCVVIYNE